LSSINDNIKLATGGNSVPDGLADWYSKTNTESLVDAEFRWLSNIDTQNSGGSIDDLWFNILRSAGYSGSLSDMRAAYWESPVVFPSELLSLKLWTRFNSGITVTGAGVSQWNDQSGNGNHLKQGTDTNRPSEEADGSILFDGVDNFLKADAFTLIQPEYVYILGRQVTWTSTDRLFDGNANNSGNLNQTGVSPDLNMYAGAVVGANNDLSLGSYGVISAAFNGASSSLKINNGTAATGNVGTANMGGFVLGANGNSTQWSNIQIKEVIILSATPSTAIDLQIINYLARVGGLSI